MTARHVLVVDDEIGIRELLYDILQDEGYQVKLAENAAEARVYREQMRPDLVLLDIWMPDCDGISLLKEWGNSGLLTMPVVMMSGHGTIDTAVEATRIGAFDFLEKPIALQKLLKTVSAALKHGEQLPRSDMTLLNLGKSPVISELRQRLEQIAGVKSPLLLIGEQGSGAELCAKFLHNPDTPWLSLTDYEQLATAPLDILEQVQEGMLFIPEVADLSKNQQKGLQLLLARADKYGARVVCVTAKSLPQLVVAGRFDNLLLQSISATSLRIPNLSDHREDIPDLARAMAALLVDSGEVLYREFDVAALNALRNAEWPGNITQLDSVIRNLMQTSLGEKITLADVNRVLEQFAAFQAALPIVETSSASAGLAALNIDKPLREARDDFERLYFEHHLVKAGHNMSRVAEAVQLERTHLYRKLKQLGIKAK
ncbi:MULTISPECIES: sigma-54 dependent transcriptional regulator [Methylovorus]|jgi:DNA-binding NtrC family response regulator|uniref:Two component, sigma54 specific, transcriptional regulator, Fis family n=1 Tax=Methylovorus glucosotrophus (strain SIP3-4) TaxID=582744 RepID=C6X8G9_METGS|nr:MULTISPECIES: sigma-54 dependent transcriptional regulator [Methylovorus]ACT49439.1 two component, sigma54 specific, transcriptional regulator, Fis family [Methylovorus glucosotrophus SIP3-4]ADQ83390.1 two component, sigma54 specific, transcriptional regulator, Fis family [Methylovorus sp. MP688]KAF0836056.1 DNA-binding NtrC family response regulator [Methylovorus glucosotrophus]